MLPAIEELNSAGNTEFAAAVGQLFECSPRFADRLARMRLFESWDDLVDRAEDLAQSLSEHDQIELIDGHPRIGADPASVSSLSYGEQGYDRAAAAGDALPRRLERLNDEYEQRFGFRFVVFVAGRPRSVIADVMEERKSADREEELERALSDVFAISRSRLVKLASLKEEVR